MGAPSPANEFQNPAGVTIRADQGSGRTAEPVTGCPPVGSAVHPDRRISSAMSEIALCGSSLHASGRSYGWADESGKATLVRLVLKEFDRLAVEVEALRASMAVKS